MHRNDFGIELVRIRKAKGLTQAEVAEKCNITIRTIQRIESGSVKPRNSTIKIISDALGIDFFEISNQNSNLKNKTILWYLKDLFNFKTNAMKKISILSTTLLILIFISVNIFNSEAQSKTPNKEEQKTETKIQKEKVDFSKDFDEFKVEGSYVFVLKGNKRGLMNLDGETIIPCKYDAFEIEGSYVFVLKGNKRGLMNINGETIIPCQYDKFYVEGSYVFVLKGNKHGLMNLDGETIIPCEYNRFKVEDGFVFVSKYNKHGLMNLDGEELIPCEYDTMKFIDGVAIVTKNGKVKQIQI